MRRADHVGNVDFGTEYFAQTIFERNIEQSVQGRAAEVAIYLSGLGVLLAAVVAWRLWLRSRAQA